MRPRTPLTGLIVSALVAAFTLAGAAPAAAAPLVPVARSAEPVVLLGAQLPAWSDLPAEGAALPWPNGALTGGRNAHAGTLVAPPHTVGVAPERIAAFRWDGETFVEVPVQVDERFPYFLQNINSDFAIYSATDEELTYEWDVESWKKTAGECDARYPDGQGAMEDPVAALDADDEVVFMASDAGGLAPVDALGPPGTDGIRQQVAIADPLDPTNLRYVYLFLRAGGSSFTRESGYVGYERDANADQWIDRYTFENADPEKLGSSNTGYGPNLSGTVCTDDTRTPAIVETGPRPTDDRFPRDGVTVTTDAYRWRATGRWMVRSLHVARPGQPGVYGPDLIDRWKGRAFQSSPDSSISLVGFEDEQVNWEANSALIGELAGPVRAIRETWGADSGTNVTKTETFYRDAIAYRYRVRVHPIPPDGLYTSWDYNAGVATTYYNVLNPDGVAIDGINDDVGNVDSLPTGQPAFFDAPDPTFSPLSPIGTWEQVSGAGDAGSLVYTIMLNSPTTLTNPAVVPYYRDDKCFDDGTGDDPVARPWPGEASTDARVRDGYAAMAGKPYAEVTCDEKQGAWGAHGIHYFFAQETDNAFASKPVDEIDATWWQFAVPTAEPTNVAQPYATTVIEPLVPVAAPLPNTAAVETRVTYTGDTSAQATDGATLAARLEDGSGAPLAGRTLHFDFQGRTWDATTDANGIAAVPIGVQGPAGSHEVTVSFEGEGVYQGSEDRAAIEVRREVTRLKLTIGGKPAAPTLVAKLFDRDDPGPGIPGRTVTFSIDGQPIGSATTDSKGQAKIAGPRNMPAGTRIGAAFDGDDTFEPSATSIVYRG